MDNIFDGSPYQGTPGGAEADVGIEQPYQGLPLGQL